MYVGRFPLFVAADLLATALLILCFAALEALRSRLRNEVLRGATLAVFAVALLLSPMLVHSVTDARLQEQASRGLNIHPTAVVYWIPAATILILVATSVFLFPRTGSQSLLWRSAYYGVCWIFLALNLANWCNPGWCEHYGFPFPYSWWSDAVISMNGEHQTARFSPAAIVANVACLVMVAAAMSLRFRWNRRRASS